MNPKIRKVAPDDLESIHAIYEIAVLEGTASFELEPPCLEEMRRRCADTLKLGFPYIVAEMESKVLGYAYAGFYRTRPAYRFTVEDSVYISTEARGRGVGSHLLKALIEESTALGFRQMIGIVGDSKHIASIRLHEKLGFTHVGTYRDIGWKHNKWLDTVLLQRQLGQGAEIPPEA